jgi:hypothetical protein
MSLKEKLAVVLKQKGPFMCPARRAPVLADATPRPTPRAAAPATALQMVLAGLKKRGNARPRTLDALSTLVEALLKHNGFAAREAKDVMARLRSQHYIEVQDGRITAYLLPPLNG